MFADRIPEWTLEYPEVDDIQDCAQYLHTENDSPAIISPGSKARAFILTHMPNILTAKIYFRMSMGNYHMVIM